MDKRLRQVTRILAERVGRDRKEHYRTDDNREGVRRRATRGVVLLLARLRGPEQPAVHLPHPGGSARTEVPWVSVDLCPAGAIGSRNCSRIAVQPDGQVDHAATRGIHHFDRDRDRCVGRMQR